jgi:hypothetical protein
MHGKARWSSPTELQIEMSSGENDPLRWEFQPKGVRFKLIAGIEKLSELRDAIRAIPDGEGDFAIGPEDDSAWDEKCLWIWWMPSGKGS